mgnify:CR=1 FL=1
MRIHVDGRFEAIQCGVGESVSIILHNDQRRLFSRRVAVLLPMGEVVRMSAGLRHGGAVKMSSVLAADEKKPQVMMMEADPKTGIVSLTSTAYVSREEGSITCAVTIGAADLMAYLDDLATSWLDFLTFRLVGAKADSKEEKQGRKEVAALRKNLEAAGIVV